jgi:signal transduction histidine kinase/ligand-binding sensor domain-containing protein
MLRRVCLILTCLWLMPRAASATDPEKRISQYAHAAWRTQDGFFPATPTALTQTPDGYIWVGTSAGLFRFDGVRFVPWQSDSGERLPAAEIHDLLSARDGSLWIATTAGVSHWKDQTLTSYASGGQTGGAQFVEDRQGAIWFLMAANSYENALCKAEPTGSRCLGRKDGFPPLSGGLAITEDASGSLWIGGSTELVRWSKTSRTSYQTRGLASNPKGVYGIAALASGTDGAIWVGIAKAGHDLGLQTLVDGRWQSFKTPDLDGSTLVVRTLAMDREGSLWIGTSDRGIYRIHGRRVDHFDSTNGLSGDHVLRFTEDREGNVWVATSQGIDRFSDLLVTSFTRRDGICTAEIDSVVAARDGGVWIGGDGALIRLRNGAVTCLRSGRELPGTQVTSLLEDHAGRLWVGVDNALWVYERGAFRRVARSDGSAIGFVSGITEDSEQRIWIIAGGPPRTLMRIENLTVQGEYREVSMPRRVAASITGGIWLGTMNGDLAFLDAGKLTTYTFVHDDSAQLNQLLPGPDGSVLAATSFGLIGCHLGKRLLLTAKNGLPCGAVNAITLDAGGNLWMYMDCGLGVMARADLETWKRTPEMPVAIKTYDVLDGVRPGYAPFDAGATSSDGRVWFANEASLQTLDPSRVQRNPIPPPVHIGQLVADRKNYPVTGTVRLPPRTRDLEIDYVGLSFVAPQKVFFRYLLEGRDQTWQEPGTRRQAFYSDLRPGRYRFRVVASNNDGVWNQQGATLDIVIAPTWYQTRTFVWLSLLASLLALWAIYRLRVRRVARALNARFDERLAERTRVARDLHDTLLQTVQGSKMVADNALGRPDDASGMRDAMERVSTWLGQAITEGRAAVNALRASTEETNDLAEAFRRAIEDCRRQGLAEAAISVSGTTRELHPVGRDEVYRVGYEAIRNACTHASASRLAVELIYNRDLIVRVEDNGVGIDPAVASSGKEGHFGLQGMRERAARLGATLTVESRAGAGTVIIVIVPGPVIFREQAASLFDRIKARLTS